MADLGSSMDVPFEEGGAGELTDTHVHYSGGLVVMAATIDVPEVGMRPALVFRFATPDGQFYPPVCLVADDDHPPAAIVLTDPQRERLALALHERWHAPCATTHGEVRCAEIAGCFDDVAALEPEILALMRGGL